MFSPITMFVLICVLLCLYTVEGSNNLIWKPYVNATVPENCTLIPGQTQLYIGLAHFDEPEYGIAGLIPTTIQNGAAVVNVTINSNTFFVSADEIDLKILCGIENSEGKLDFVSTTAEEFPSLFDTNTKPIPVGFEYNHKNGANESEWFNATLFAGIVDFYSKDESHRVVVAKVFEDANESLNYNAFYADLGTELSSSKYDVMVLRT